MPVGDGVADGAALALHTKLVGAKPVGHEATHPVCAASSSGGRRQHNEKTKIQVAENSVFRIFLETWQNISLVFRPTRLVDVFM